jgi:hypothetical protein
MSKNTFQSLVIACHNALEDCLCINEVIDHLTFNEGLTLVEARSIALAACRPVTRR